LITVTTTLKELPDNHKVIFYGEIRNEKDQLLGTGNITMYFMKADDMSKSKMPEKLYQKLVAYFS
jgi:acyl-CoA thioester hydrolase